MLEHLTGYRCVRCDEEYPTADGDRMTCEACGIEGILDVLYDDDRVLATLSATALAERPPTIWRYRELLPVADLDHAPPAPLGMSPLLEAPRLARELGLARVWLKDEGRGPTASFKDRASAVGVARALDLGRGHIACASTGNAATSLAGAAAQVGMSATIFVPERAPEPKIAQLLIFGARVVRVLGSYDDAYRLCQAACERYGWYNRNCAVNPVLVEGKKTCGLEIAEQLPEASLDWVAVSVGDGCTIAGIGKGLEEMARLGLSKARPRLLGVQATGSAPIADAFDQGGELTPGGTDTFADSIAVSHPRNWRKAVAAVRRSGGAFCRVTDDEIRAAMRDLARLGGVFGEPAAAASLAGLRAAVRDGVVAPGSRALCVVTGNGLKDTQGALGAVGAPLEVAPDLDALAGLLQLR